MLKRINLLVVLAAAIGVGAFLVARAQRAPEGPWALRGKSIEIYAQDYTLERLAREIGDREILRYDPATREAVAYVSVVVYGSLHIGHPTDEALGETLLLDTVVCGDLRLEVARGGALTVHHSTVQTVSQVITVETCSKGYALNVDGTLEAAHSRFLYMSGSRSETARRHATVRLRDVSFSLSDGTSFRFVEADGARIDIADCTFRCEGQYGVIVDGLSGAPIELRDCRLRGTAADLQLMGRNAQAVLVDCRFSKSKVKFYQAGARVTVRWSVTARVVEAGSGRPVPGVQVVATSTGVEAGEPASARTAQDGTCELVLTEYVATPVSPTRHDGTNNVTPHRVVARASDGTVLAEVAGYDARGSHGTVTLEVPSGTLSSAP